MIGGRLVGVGGAHDEKWMPRGFDCGQMTMCLPLAISTNYSSKE